MIICFCVLESPLIQMIILPPFRSPRVLLSEIVDIGLKILDPD